MRTPPTIRRALAAASLPLALLCAPASVLARPYAIDVDVVDGDDLRELLYDGLLPEDEYNILIRLIENPIDLNRAEKMDVFQLPEVDAGLAEAIVEERILNGPYVLLADLVSRVEGVTWRLVDQLRPFVFVRVPEGTKAAVRGEVGYITFKRFRAIEPITDDYPARSHSAAQLGFDKFPPMAFGAHLEVKGWVDGGFVGTAQEGLWNVTYDPASQDIFGAYGTPVFRPYMGFVRVRRPVGRARFEAVAGSYQLNYGEGLVMNTLGGRKRSGFSVNAGVNVERSDSRFLEWDGLFGGATRVVAPLSGPAEIDVSLFGSLRHYDQYVGYVKAAAGQRYDPAADDDLPTLRVFVDGQRLAYQTLPNVLRVGVVGGNASVRFNKRTALGVTGYAGLLDRTLMRGVELENELLLKRRWPVNLNFGAVGFFGRVGFGLLEVSGEYALFLGDRVGQGMIVFVELEPAWGRFEFSARHYDVDFANPYASVQADSRTIGGISARGEQGIRLLSSVAPIKQVGARVTLDLNRSALLDVWDFEFKGSVRGRPLEWMQLELLGTYTNQNLAVNGRNHIYSGSLSVDDLEDYGLAEDPSELSLNRAGERISLAPTVRVDHKKIGALSLRYKREWIDAGKTHRIGDSDRCDTDWMQGHTLRVWGTVRPSRTTTISGSWRIEDQDVAGNKASPSSGSGNVGGYGFETSLAVAQKVADTVTLRLRGQIGKRLPNPPSGCDEGDDFVWDEPIYDPSAYDLRWFGDVSFQMKVAFR